MKSCTECSQFFSCSKLQKIKGVICENFQDLSELKKEKKDIFKIEQKKETEIEEEGKLKIPEEDLPLAKNIFEFITRKNFLNLGKNALFPKQFEILINFFSDYCPKCSDVNYLNRNIAVSDRLDYILERVTLLEHDVCPKCKNNKLNFIKEGLLADYYEMAGLAGQRCLTGDTLITCVTVDDLKKRDTDLGHKLTILQVPLKEFSNNISGFSEYKGKYFTLSNFSHTLKYECLQPDLLPLYLKPSHVFESADEEPIIEITAEYKIKKIVIKGTPEHKLLKVTGTTPRFDSNFCPLKDLVIGNEIAHVDTETGVTWCLKITSKKCLHPEKVYDLRIPYLHTYLANEIISHNSGKSYISAISQAYTTHRFFKLKSPQETFGISRSTPLVGTFLALNKNQVAESVWGYYKSLVDTSPWFLEFHEMLTHYGNKIGRKLIDYHNKESIECTYKNIKVALRSPNASNLRGATRFQGGIDEIGWFDAEHDDKKTLSANELYAAISNSMATMITKFESQRRSGLLHLPTPTLINVSSPSHVRDKICTLVDQFKQEDKDPSSSLRRYWFHYATWDINPDFPKDSVFIKSKYKVDALKAERDFAAKPPLSSNTFFSEKDNILKVFNGNKNLLELDYSLEDLHAGYKFKILNQLSDKSRNRVLAVDLGYNDNSTSLSIGYWDDSKSMVVYDAVGEIIPTKENPINFRILTESIIKPLIKQFNVSLVTCDKWQSLSLTQNLKETMKMETLTYSLKLEDFYSFKQQVLDSKIKLPQLDKTDLIANVRLDNYPFIFYKHPVAHLYYQFLTVSEGSKNIQKGESATDDIFRSVVLLHYVLTNLEHRKKVNQNKIVKSNESQIFLNGQSMKDKGGGGGFKFKGKNVFVC